MFEIGNSLREARLRQGLDFPEIEQATKIRPKYLRALEDEQFDIPPGQTYVKGFLRTYAEYLGLDGQLYVDEYNSRYVHVDEETPLRARSSTPSLGARGVPRFESSVVLIAIAAIGILTLLVFAAWRFGSDTPETGIPDFSTRPPATKPKPNPAPRRTVPARRAKLTISAVSGNSVVEVYGSSLAGKQLFKGTVEDGHSIRFAKNRRYILKMDSPGNLEVVVNGDFKNLPARGPATVIVTANSIRRVAST
ncbi:MAG TPA: helix-turn-helix domain-containing protein [Gaiellaceae bacterium]|nr:helix-turn-helix domain-containing protein [Gaiellaceae bacterium]